MNNYFTVKIKCTEQNEKGIFKRKVYSYLISAQSFTEAETKIYEHFEPVKTVSDLSISSIQRSDYHDIYENQSSSSFCVVKISFENHELDNSKRVTQKLLVTADSIEEATEIVMERLSITSLEYKIESVSVSPITDYLNGSRRIHESNIEVISEEMNSIELDLTSSSTSNIEVISEEMIPIELDLTSSSTIKISKMYLTSKVTAEEINNQEEEDEIEPIILNK